MKRKYPRALKKCLIFIGGSAFTLAALFFVSGCGDSSPHDGRLPFSWMENVPGQPRGIASQKMQIVMQHNGPEGNPSITERSSLRAGDVIAFHMSHHESWTYLRKGMIQKIPYDFFQYGHLAIVVPASDSSEKRLLQVAMKQAVNDHEGLDYLNGKSWVVYRPPSGSINEEKLKEFTRIVTEKAGDPKHAYDYPSALGITNAPCQPDTQADIGGKFSCATLVIAALHYSGFQLKTLHRGGKLDLVTPRQVVESYGTK